MSHPIAPAEPAVILINRSLSSGCVGRLTGRSGVEYGQSFWEDARGAHVCRLPLSRWREVKEDITYGMARRMSQWEVDFEIEPTASAGSASAVELPQVDAGEPKHSAESLAAVTNYRQLLGLARKAGVADPEAIDTREGLRAAILERVNLSPEVRA